MARSVLVVDDEELIRRSLRLGLEDAGYRVSVAASGKEALAQLADGPDGLIVDLRLGDANGLDVLREARARNPLLPALVISAHGDMESAIQALRLGAFDFIRKPFEIEEVVTAVGNALRTEQLERRVAYLEGRAGERNGELVHGPGPMAAVLEQVGRIAEQPVPVVLVSGESGTGKELVARALHQRSSRASGPFVELNCSALPEQLVESELFGHERGAFSDAREQKKGLVELADGGTLFLDEIGDLAASAQAKLLKFVESKQFRRVGGTKTLEVDCRIVAATHRDLAQAASFRRDLYFRIAGVTLRLPPLRERGGDLLLLARHFVGQFAREYRKPIEGLTLEAEALLARHRWPGNVRELRAAIAQALLVGDGPRLGAELFAALRAQPPASEGHEEPLRTLEEVELEHCRRVLEASGGNKALAAERLGISRHTLARKLGSADEPS